MILRKILRGIATAAAAIGGAILGDALTVGQSDVVAFISTAGGAVAAGLVIFFILSR
jgi:hypothetical protein